MLYSIRNGSLFLIIKPTYKKPLQGLFLVLRAFKVGTTIFEIIQEIRVDKSILFITQDFTNTDIFSDRIILINNGSIGFNGTLNNLEQEINDIYKFRFTFKRIVPNDFIQNLRSNNDIQKIQSKDNNIQIIVKDKRIFFDVFKIAVNYELIDFEMSDSKITELFERIMKS